MRTRRARIGQDVKVGARAGVLGTLVMSVWMLGAQRTGFRHAEQPPKRVVEHTLDVAGVRRHRLVDGAVATLAHVGYGAALGAAYRVVRARTRVRGPALLHGALYGLGVWAVNYAGVLPAARVLPPPHRDEPRRQAAMVAAHLIFGGVVGLAGDPVRGPAAEGDGGSRQRAAGSRDRRGGPERQRPPAARSTAAVPGGETVTSAQDVEPGGGRVHDDHTVTRPVDVEPESGAPRSRPRSR